MKLSSVRTAAVTTAAVLAAGGIASAATTTGAQASSGTSTTFALVRSAGSVAAGCLTHAKATVNIKRDGQVEIMTIDASGLPPRTGFDVFITQLPNAPFGLSWYQGDLDTNRNGNAHVEFLGRFSDETFVVAPGSGPAPVVDSKDASTNPATDPVHMFHVGVWFNSPARAAAAGCANAVTPFNGEHHAGPQALSTRQFGDAHGPLRRIQS